MKKASLLPVIVGAGLLASSTAMAFHAPGVYVIGGLGTGSVSNAKLDQGGFDIDGLDAFNASTSTDDTFTWRVGVGTWLSDHVGLEFNYQDFNDSKSGAAIGSDFVSLKSSDTYAFDLSTLYRAHFTSNSYGFAKAGIAYASQDRRFTSTSGGIIPSSETYNDDRSGVGALLGFGVQVDLNQCFGVRLEANTVQASDVDTYSFTGNVVVNLASLFGYKS